MRTRKVEGDRLQRTLGTIGYAIARFPSYDNYQEDYHRHDFVEMFYVLEGSGIHRIQDQQFPLKEGMVSIVHFDQSHSIEVCEPGSTMDIVNIYINPERFRLPSLPSPLAGILPRVIPLAPGLVFHQNRINQMEFPHPVNISWGLKLIHLEWEQQYACYQEAVRLLLDNFLLSCARLAQFRHPGVFTTSDPGEAAMERVRDYLDHHFRDPANLDLLAEKFRVSKGHLCRSFHKYTGKTIVEYIHQRRIEQALVLLDSTREKVIAISHECGFSDLSQFNRVFKRLIGTSPGNFRKRKTEE